jgi:hypothetical protein
MPRSIQSFDLEEVIQPGEAKQMVVGADPQGHVLARLVVFIHNVVIRTNKVREDMAIRDNPHEDTWRVDFDTASANTFSVRSANSSPLSGKTPMTLFCKRQRLERSHDLRDC